MYSMSICPFKEGELIICIDTSMSIALTRGKVYTVQKHISIGYTSPSVTVICDDHYPQTYNASRFISVNRIAELNSTDQSSVIELFEV